MLQGLASSVFAVVLAASGPTPVVPTQLSPNPDELLATVNGTKIMRSDVDLAYNIDKARRANSAVGTSPAAVPKQMKGIMLQLIQIELLYQEAGRREFSIDENELNEVVASLKGKGKYAALPISVLPDMTESDIVTMAGRTMMLGLLRADIAKKIQTTDEDAKLFFARNKTTYRTKEEVDIRQILFKVKPPDTEDTVRKRAETVRDAALAGEDFAELARTFSDDPSAMRGGKIGTYTWGTMARAFETTVFSTPVGDVSEPIRSRFGFHLVKVEAHRKPRQPEFDELRERVIADLIAKLTDRQMSATAVRLHKEGNVWYKDKWDTDIPPTPRSP